jgi:signal transduction histidine kinase
MSEPGNSMSFLVVDDNDVEGLLLSDTLGHAFPGARVTAMTEPDEAVAFCSEKAPSCLFIDYNMPRMDGLQLGAAIQSRALHVPMVLMTAVGDELLAATALHNGFADYIPKSRINEESAARIVKRAIRAVEQSRKIEEQHEELEQFAYALAHDFKQPIRQISTFSEILQQQLADAADQTVKRNLNFMHAAARRLGALVDMMSQYTLLNKAPELAMVDIDDVVAGVRLTLQSYIAERNGALASECTGLQIYGNATLLGQVLQNLVINGLRYNQSPAPCVELTIEEGLPGRRRLRVRDNGIGMEEQFLEDIFKPLFRLHSASEYPGTGLGLTITRKAVLAQGGSISCTSEVGVGSEFVIELSSGAPRQEGTV